MSFLKTVLASMVGFIVAQMVLVGFLVAMMFVIIASAGEKAAPAVQTNSVLILEPDGVIPEYLGTASLGRFSGNSDQQTLRDYLLKIDAAKTDKRIRGIWLKLGDYRGSWAQATEL